jgi:trimeric autotransporter adhesin
VACSDGCSGFVSDITKGGLSTRQGAVSATGNNPPTVSTAAAYTIPIRTPFALTGSAADPDGDTVTYLWEQNDRGGSTATALTSNVKANGPLFRQFGTRAVFDAGIYNPPGQNQTTTDPTRVFPDLAQVLANTTNAETGSCASFAGAAQVDCLSEFLPTADYVGFAGVNASPARLNFRLTARDGRGGVNSANTVLTLAPGAGPFLVTAPNAAVSLPGAEPTTVSWSVAGTNVAPVGTTQVRILLSTDGGLTWPTVLNAGTANDGSEPVTLPNLATTQARVRVEAVGNVFFDVSNSNFTIVFTGDVDGSGTVDCADYKLIIDLLGVRAGDPRYSPAIDFNANGVIDKNDVAFVRRRLPEGTVCPTRPPLSGP